MYGPPPDPRQVLAPIELVDDWRAYLICVAVGLAITAFAAWKRAGQALRAGFFCLGQTVVLTAPLLAHLDRYVYGAYPTIDKEGSLLFYLDGVQRRMLLHPIASLGDPAARLIGVHVGHLWVTQFFDLFFTPVGAFNAQALLYPALGWWACWLLLREVGADSRVALLMGFPFGLELHVFRDLNWYTIEKSAVFWLPLFAWALYRAWRDGGYGCWIAAAGLFVTTWMNLYLGLLAAALAALALLAEGYRSLRRGTATSGLCSLAVTCAAGAVLVSPLAVWQWALMNGGPSVGSPERFLWERAALDGMTLVPPRWDRLEVHRALNLVGLGLGLFGMVRMRRSPLVRFAVFAGGFLFLLSIGPVLFPGPVLNPVYMAVRAVVPMFWRVAKPEVFFYGTWMLILCVAAVQLTNYLNRHRGRVRTGGIAVLYAVFVLGWLLMVRTHPAYPEMSLPVKGSLAPGWQERVFRTSAPASRTNDGTEAGTASHSGGDSPR